MILFITNNPNRIAPFSIEKHIEIISKNVSDNQNKSEGKEGTQTEVPIATNNKTENILLYIVMKKFAAGAYINTFGNTSDQCRKNYSYFCILCIFTKYDIECGNT